MNFNKHIKKELLNEFGGSEKKKTVILDDGKKYLLKFPDPVRNKDADVSYINNAISEYIGCKVVASLGLDVQQVILGEYTDRNGKVKIVCACEDVRKHGETMHQMEILSLGNIDSITKKESSIKSMEEYAASLNEYIPTEVLRKFYYDMFIADAFIGNTDRHNGNWAVLTDEMGNARMSPIFDCGSSFSPLLSDNELDYRHLSNDALNTFSVILDEDGKRIHYKDYLSANKNPDISNAARRIIPRMNLHTIAGIIDNTDYISDKRKQFYKDLISMRYEKLMIPALQKIFSLDKQQIENSSRDYSSDDFRIISKRVADVIRKMHLYQCGTVMVGGEAIAVQRLSKRYAIALDENGEAITTLNLGKDFQDLKEFIAGMAGIGIDLGVAVQHK